MQKSFKVMSNIFEISQREEMQNFYWSMQTSFHQSPKLKQIATLVASCFRTFMKKKLKSYEKINKKLRIAFSILSV